MEIGIHITTVITICIIYVLSKWLLTAVNFIIRTLKITKTLKRQFPTPKYHWFYGHLATHPGSNHEGLLKNFEWTKNNPRYYIVFVGPLKPVLALHHPDTVKEMLKTSEPKDLSPGGGYTLLKPWIGDGLLVSSGNKWFRNRKLLTPGFHFDVLKPYMEVYNSCAELLMKKFVNLVETGQSIDIYGPVGLCTLDIILRCAFSANRPIQEDGGDNPYVKTVSSLSNLLVKRAMNPLLYFDFLYYLTANGRRFKYHCEDSHNIARELMHKRRGTLENDTVEKSPRKRRYLDFLDILLLARDENGSGLTDTEIQDEVETFMFEGHDTTASGISWILYNLARHPEFQSRARQEVDSLLSNREDGAIQWGDMTKLPYLTMCIKESLRLHPPVHFISRETTKPFVIDGKTVLPNTVVEIGIWNVHHNPTVWKNPMVYDPDRFLLEKTVTMDSHAFIPFSAGPRNCIGQTFAMNEMKTIIARILHRFEFELDESKVVRMLPDVVLRPENGIHIFFTKRAV